MTPDCATTFSTIRSTIFILRLLRQQLRMINRIRIHSQTLTSLCPAQRPFSQHACSTRQLGELSGRPLYETKVSHLVLTQCTALLGVPSYHFGADNDSPHSPEHPLTELTETTKRPILGYTTLSDRPRPFLVRSLPIRSFQKDTEDQWETVVLHGLLTPPALTVGPVQAVNDPPRLPRWRIYSRVCIPPYPCRFTV